jgi:hypothetical protein
LKLALELYTEKPLCVKDDTYFRTALSVNNRLFTNTEGLDQYHFHSIIGSNKRVAGLGRTCTYTLNSLPGGLGPVEARPGKYFELLAEHNNATLIIETNLVLDPGILSDTLGIRLVNGQGKNFDVPFSRPDVKIMWESRGKYTVFLSEVLCSRLLQAVS